MMKQKELADFVLGSMEEIKLRIERIKITKGAKGAEEVIFYLKILSIIDYLSSVGKFLQVNHNDVAQILTEVGDILFEEERKFGDLDIRMPDGSPYLSSKYAHMRRMEKTKCLKRILDHHANAESRKKQLDETSATMSEIDGMQNYFINKKTGDVDVSSIINKMKSGE